MEGYHFSANGGVIDRWNQEIAFLDLPAGQYIVFAKVQLAIGYLTPDPFGSAYQALLEANGVKDDLIAGLIYDYDDPGSRSESIALNIATENDSIFRVSLIINATTMDRVYAYNPRISAFQLDRLHSFTADKEMNAKEHQAFESQRLAMSALTGVRALQ